MTNCNLTQTKVGNDRATFDIFCISTLFCLPVILTNPSDSDYCSSLIYDWLLLAKLGPGAALDFSPTRPQNAYYVQNG